MIIVATDAPIDARNLGRLASRALLGMGRTGSSASNGSGDYVIAFSTQNRVRGNERVRQVTTLGNEAMSPLFEAVTEATEEAIYNSLFKATTVVGRDGRSLDDAWSRANEGYLGITIPGFPNWFMLGGPNSPIGNFSWLMTSENQLNYAMQLIDYLRSGPQFFVQASRAKAFPDMLALCGKTVGTSRRTSFPGEIAAWSEANCKPAGKPAITVVGTDGSADARTQLRQGRVDAAMQGNETLPYVMGLEPNAYVAVGERISSQFTGIGVAKGAADLQEAIASAPGELVTDGSYKKILDKWKLSEDAIEKVTINAGP